MATKAELEAELALLKKEIAERDKLRGPSNKTARNSEPVSDARKVDEVFQPMLDDALKRFGLEKGDLEDLWAKLSEELNHLPQKKPVLTLALVFGLGFVAGRMSK